MLQTLTGSAKAAVFLLSLDPDEAVRVVAHLDDDELKALREASEVARSLDGEAVAAVCEAFARDVERGVAALRAGPAYFEDLVRHARGDEQAEALFAAPPADEGVAPLEALGDVDPEMLSLGLAGVHPQVVAAVLAHITPAVAAYVLERRPDEERADLVRRIATLSTVPPDAFADAEAALAGLDLEPPRGQEVDGVGTAAAILGELDEEAQNALLEKLAEERPEEAETIRRAMFTFAMLIDVDRRGMQQLLREIETDTLLTALKTASDELKEKFFSSMSSRAAAMLQDELEAMPPVRLDEVEKAQQSIAETALRMANEGKIVIVGRGEQMV